MELGVKCSRGFILHEDCRKCALHPLHPCGYPPDLLEMMRNGSSGEPGMDAYTPSRLLNQCERQRILCGKHDYYIPVDAQWPRIRGTMVHSLFEKGGTYPGILTSFREVRLECRLSLGGSKEVLFTGKADFIGVVHQDGDEVHVKVVDYKTTNYISAKLLDLSQDTKGRQYIMQVNMYAWLVRRALPEALKRAVTVIVDELEIVFFDMKRVVRFTTAGDISYGGRTYRAIPFLEDAQVEAWIRQRILEKQQADRELPDVLEGYPDHWACQRCPVFNLCKEIKETHENQPNR